MPLHGRTHISGLSLLLRCHDSRAVRHLDRHAILHRGIEATGHLDILELVAEIQQGIAHRLLAREEFAFLVFILHRDGHGAIDSDFTVLCIDFVEIVLVLLPELHARACQDHLRVRMSRILLQCFAIHLNGNHVDIFGHAGAGKARRQHHNGAQQHAKDNL